MVRPQFHNIKVVEFLIAIAAMFAFAVWYKWREEDSEAEDWNV